jgi:hypothetical protein
LFSKAKAGLFLGALATVLSVGSVASVYAAAEDQAVTEKTEQNGGAQKGAWFWLKGFKGEGKAFVKGAPVEENAELLALLKLDAAKLKEELKAGKSLAEIASAQGVSTEAVIDLLTKQHEANLAEAVKAGKLTQEQADKLKENTAERVKAFVENTHVGKGFIEKRHVEENAELLALLKLDAAKLKEELKAGKSLAEIAAAQGVSTEAVIDLLTKQHEEKLAEAVKAGKLTQEQADKLKENTAERVKAFVENTHVGKGPGFIGKWRAEDNAELLALLKLDAAKLKEELKAGKSLAEIASAQGVSTEAVIDLLTKQHEEKLAEAVKAGKLTQEQADKIKADWENRVKQLVERKHSGSKESDKESNA